MGKRRQARILALQVMYQYDAGHRPTDEIFSSFWETQEETTAEVRHFVEELVSGFLEHSEKIDLLIGDYSRHWEPERMAVVDRNILRLAIFELLYREDIPPKVTINEFVDVAKKYSTEESGAFVNGILDRIFHEQGRAATQERGKA
jgi:N utilization substance protein B